MGREKVLREHVGGRREEFLSKGLENLYIPIQPPPQYNMLKRMYI